LRENEADEHVLTLTKISLPNQHLLTLLVEKNHFTGVSTDLTPERKNYA